MAGLADLPDMAQLPDVADLPDIVDSVTDAVVQPVKDAVQAPVDAVEASVDAAQTPVDEVPVNAVQDKMDPVQTPIKDEPIPSPRVEVSAGQQPPPQGTEPAVSTEPEGLTQQQPPQGTEPESSTPQQQQPEGTDQEGKPQAEAATQQSGDIQSMDVDLDELFGDTEDMEQTDGYDSEQDQQDQTRTPPASMPHTPSTHQFQHQPGCPHAQYHGLTGPRAQEVMDNVAIVKESISSNHTLVARFLGLQTAYRSIYSAMTHERSLREKAVMALVELQHQIRKPYEPSPQQIAHYTSRISQLSSELANERNHRIAAEKSLVQYQSDMQKMKMRLDRHMQDLAKVERDAKIRCDAFHKDVDRHKMSVVSLMSENKSLQAKLKENSPENVFTEKEAMQKEIDQLRNRVIQLEAINIRLKVGKSVLSKNDQDAHFNIS